MKCGTNFIPAAHEDAGNENFKSPPDARGESLATARVIRKNFLRKINSNPNCLINNLQCFESISMDKVTVSWPTHVILNHLD